MSVTIIKNGQWTIIFIILKLLSHMEFRHLNTGIHVCIPVLKSVVKLTVILLIFVGKNSIKVFYREASKKIPT